MPSTHPPETPGGAAPQRILIAPASFAQERLWFLHQCAPDSPQYNIPIAYRMRGDVDTRALRGALNALAQRHEAFRTSFALAKSGVEQRIAPSAAWPIEAIDFSARGPEIAVRDALERARRDSRHPFDLVNGPPMRASLIRLGPRDHLLVLVIHHIIFDEWSQDIVEREIGVLYDGIASGRVPTLDHLPIGYADFSAWERETLAGTALENALAFWRGHLAGAPPHLDLPVDHPGPAIESTDGALLTTELAASIPRAIESVARLERATPFMVHLAAFAILLHRYARATDIVIGTPVTNRGRQELQGLVGFFLNTLPIRITLDPKTSFLRLLRDVRETALAAYSHRQAPFEKVVGALGPLRDRSSSPIFQAMLATRETSHDPPRFRGLDTVPVEVHTGTSKFDLTAWVDHRPAGTRLRAEFKTALFNPSRIEALLGHWGVLLRAIADDPASPLSALPILPREERSRIECYARGNPAPSAPTCLPQAFEAAVARWPDRVAVSTGQTSLTYDELQRRANAIARRLLDEGAAPDTPIGLCARRSPDALVGILGILKAGAPYVPIDPSHPANRVLALLDDARCQTVVTGPDVPQPAGVRILPVIDASRCEPSEGPAIHTRTHHLAYIMYTSGSTGRPKGVAMEHGPLANLVAWQARQPPRPAAKTLQFAPLGFDVSFQECFSTWIAGGELVIAPEPARADPTALWHFVCRHRIERLFLPVAMLRHLAEVATRSPGACRASVSAIITAGESLEITPAIRSLFHALDDAKLINQYGPTECHVVTSFALTGDPGSWPGRPPIGSPIDNAVVRLLDAHMQPVPIGIPGEIFIGGPVLARGYWRQPDLTAARFLPDPFDDDPSARLYRTGDIGRYRPDGEIEFLGRTDDQIKIRGFRIEPAEIEATLGSFDGVRQAAVVARGEAPNASLAAFIVPDSTGPPSPDALRHHAHQHLPDHMVPSTFEIIEELPLSPSGKVDRRRLAGRARPRPPHGDREASPRNLLEFRLLHIWRGLFASDTIGRDDNFFELGGHSLLAARFASEVESLIGHPVPPSMLFHAPTIAGLACALGDKNWAPPWSSLVPMHTAGTKPPFFFVHGMGGDAYAFLELARALAPHQPTYAVQAVDLAGRSRRHESIEAMAAHYAGEISSLQPTGRCYLGGYSLGGVIAYEVARHLRRLGRQIGMLALIDSHATCSVPWSIYARLMLPFFANRSRHHLARFLSLPRRERLVYLRGRMIALRNTIARNLGRRLPTPLPESTARAQRDNGAAIDHYLATAAAYKPGPFDGIVDLFLSENARPHSVSLWRYLAAEVRLHEVAGQHLEILDRDHVAQFAKTFAAALARAQSEEA